MNDARNSATALAQGNRRRELLVGGSVAFTALAFLSIRTLARGGDEEISHTAECIHQEPIFKANPRRVYEALTDAKEFHNVTQLGAAMRSGMALGSKPTQISREAGGPFTLFGGHIVGRHIELVPNKRIVQAWRVADWNPGIYSIVKFELSEQGPGAKLVFDHTGFPDGKGQHLAEGWRANYWEPLEKYLS